MASRITPADLAVFSAGGQNFLADLRGLVQETRTMSREVTPVTSLGVVREPVRRGVSVTAKLTSRKVSGARVTHLDLGAISLAGVNLLGSLLAGRFEGILQHQDAAGVGDEWQRPVLVGRDFRVRLRVAIDPSGSWVPGTLPLDSLPGQKSNFALNLNSVPISLPMLIHRTKQIAEQKQVQIWEIDLLGNQPTTGSGTGSGMGLLESALNAPATPLTIETRAESTTAPLTTGAFLVQKFGFGFTAAEVVESDYTWVSTGPVQAVMP